MPNTTLSVNQLFELLHAEFTEMSLLRFFESEFRTRLTSVPGNPTDWQNLPWTERNAAELMGLTIRILEDMATRFAHTTDDSVYEEATRLAQQVHIILAECYGFQPCTIRIMSPTRRMEQAGLIKVTQDTTGELYVRPTSPLS